MNIHAGRSILLSLIVWGALASAGSIASGHGAVPAGGAPPSPRFATTLLSMPAGLAGVPQAIVQVPITVTPADGILGADVTVAYDPAVLEAQSVTTSGIAAAAGFALVANLNTPGVILISTYATGDALVGSGDLARIQFRVRGNPGDLSTLTFTSASLNEGEITPTFHNGAFTTLTPKTVLSLSGDAQGGRGTTVSIPMSAAPADGIFGIDLVVRYDPAVLLAQSVTVSGMAQTVGFAAAANLNTPGTVIISTYATSNPLQGSGEILRIGFLVLADTGARSSLTFASASINEGAIPVDFSPGLFIVNCAGAANGVACDDGDAATCEDVCGEEVCTGVAVPEPAEVNDSVRLSQSGATATIGWTDQPGPFNAYRGARGTGTPFAYNQICLDPGFPAPGPSLADSVAPPVGTVFFYLLTRVDRCRESIPGRDSTGAPIPNSLPCPIAGP